MGATRACLTIKVRDQTIYVNERSIAEKFLQGFHPPDCKSAYARAAVPTDEITQRVATIEAGLRVQHALAAGSTITPLSSAIRALRQLNRATNDAKHEWEEHTHEEQDSTKAEAEREYVGGCSRPWRCTGSLQWRGW